MTAAATPARASLITVVACVLAAVCEGFDLQAAGVAAAGMGAQFHPSPAQMTAFFSVGTFGLLLGALIGGRLSDAFGRKPLLVGSVACFGLFCVVTGCAWNTESLIAGRLLTGFGLGGAFPVIIALVNEQSPPHRRRANVALAYSAMPLGGALVSLLSLVASAGHWRLIFLIGGALPLLLAPALAMGMRDSAARTSGIGPPAAAARQGGSGRYIDIFTGGRAFATVLLWVSSFLILLSLYLFLNWLPTLLVQSGFDKTQASGAQLGFNVGGAFAALGLGQLLEGRYRSPSLAITFLSAPVLVYLLSHSTHDFLSVALIAFALGAAVIAGQGYLYAVGAGIYPSAIRGAGMGATVAAGRTGSVAGPVLGGLLKAAGHGPSQLLMDILPLVILGSVTSIGFAWLVSRSTFPGPQHDEP